MEIDNNRIASLAAHVSGQGAPVDNQRTGNGNSACDSGTLPGGGSDRVSLTGEALRLKSLESELAERPVVDQQRVEAVRSAVENGTFEINPQRIADKLISLEQALTDLR